MTRAKDMGNTSLMLKKVLLWPLVLGLVAQAGCGGSKMPLVRVSGQITFDGAPPPAPGNITFNPIPGTGTKGMPLRPGRAQFGTDGRYQATSFKDDDGLLPGKYEVRIFCMSGEPGVDGQYADLTFVPPDYMPEPFLVKEGERNMRKDFDIPLHKR